MNFRIVKTVADLELVKQRLGALVFPHFRRGPAIHLGRLMRESRLRALRSLCAGSLAADRSERKYEGLVRFNEGKSIGGVVRRKKGERRGDRNARG